MKRADILDEINKAKRFFHLGGGLADEPRASKGQVLLRELGLVVEWGLGCTEEEAIAKIHRALISGELPAETLSGTPIPTSCWPNSTGQAGQGGNWFWGEVFQDAVGGFDGELPIVLLPDAVKWISTETAGARGRPRKIDTAMRIYQDAIESGGLAEGEQVNLVHKFVTQNWPSNRGDTPPGKRSIQNVIASYRKQKR